MNSDTVSILIAGGFFMLLILLRLDAGRFGAAEYDEPGVPRANAWTRLSWYIIGLALVAAIYFVHPSPHRGLYLIVGGAADVALYGTLLAIVGVAQAAGFAWLRYGNFRWPGLAAYPGAAINVVATAIIDEATFRGVLLGTLVAIGVPDGWSIVVAALIYALSTRMGAPGRHPYMLLLVLGMGLVCGWATLASGGLGAAILGHVAASFSLFVFTGHSGQVPPAGLEPEELESRKAPPDGWQVARLAVAGRADGGSGGRGSGADGATGSGASGSGAAWSGVESEAGPWQIEESGFSDRTRRSRRRVTSARSGGVVDRVRALGRLLGSGQGERPRRSR